MENRVIRSLSLPAPEWEEIKCLSCYLHPGSTDNELAAPDSRVSSLFSHNASQVSQAGKYFRLWRQGDADINAQDK